MNKGITTPDILKYAYKGILDLLNYLYLSRGSNYVL